MWLYIINRIDKLFEGAKRNLAAKKISKKNKEIIQDFLDYLAADDVKKARQIKYIYILVAIAKRLKKDFPSANKKEEEIVTTS